MKHISYWQPQSLATNHNFQVKGTGCSLFSGFQMRFNPARCMVKRPQVLPLHPSFPFSTPSCSYLAGNNQKRFDKNVNMY